MKLGKKKIRSEKLNYLNLTSMMDIFTNLLFFLLMSYSTAEFTITPPKDLQLPKSISRDTTEIMLTTVVSMDAVFVDGEKVILLQNGLIGESDMHLNDKLIVVPLSKALSHYRELARMKELTNKEYSFKGKIMLQADKILPFETIKRIMYTAEKENFTLFKLAIFKER